jgi:fibrillarin-like rRNA methylase
MDALTFLKKHGRQTAANVAVSAGTNMAYFSQIAYGHRRASVELAHRLVAASEQLIPVAEDRLDLLSLLQAKVRPVERIA